jgi:hypothetical protein
VLVGGEPIVEDGKLVRADEKEIVARVRKVTGEWEPATAEPLPVNPATAQPAGTGSS